MASVIDMVSRHRVLYTLLGINCAVFFILSVAALVARFGAPEWSLLPGWFEMPGSVSAWIMRPWTLLTYMVTQVEFLHLFFNMLWLIWFGDILMSTLGQRHLLGLYLCGGVAGGLLYLAAASWVPALCPPGSVLIGSSASVLAVMAATAFRSPDYTFHLFFIGDVRLKWIAVFMIVLAFIGLGGGNAGGQVAHIGGVAFGSLQGLLLRRGIDIFGRHGRSRQQFKRRPAKVLSAIEQHRRDAARLDELLDKIRISGFNSLNKKEREELDRLSQKITK